MHDSQNSTQKTSSVYKLILKTQQILVWTKQPYSFFEHTHPKIIKVTFLGLHHYAKKVHSIHSWDKVNFGVLWPDLPHPFLTMPIQKNWFMWICINMQKIMLFHWFVLETWLIKKSCNLIGWEYFDYLKEFFPNIVFVQEHSK